ncbi:MAG: rod shape-determining protein [Blastocatellia bacterium]|nr:rod shape-determining protein [Blastocatellia bacterium]
MLKERMKGRIVKNFFKKFRRVFLQGVAIDLGTVNTLIYVEKQGIVLNEPSAIAINKYTGEVIAVGKEAMLLLGREPVDTVVHRPMKDGTIADYDMAEKMLVEFLKRTKVLKWNKMFHIVTATPNLATGVERRALKSAARGTGAQQVTLLEEGLAAALGAGVMGDGARAGMIVDIGGGTTNITVASESGIIHSASLKAAGNEMNQNVTDLVTKKYRMMIGEQVAEAIKIELGAAINLGEERYVKVIGKSVPDFKVKEFVLGSSEVSQVLEKTIQAIIDGVLNVIEQTSPNVAVDLYHHGIVLTGGGALLKGLEARFKQEVEMPVRVAPNPMESVVLGAGKLLGSQSLLERYQLQEETLEWESAPNYRMAN